MLENENDKLLILKYSLIIKIELYSKQLQKIQ